MGGIEVVFDVLRLAATVLTVGNGEPPEARLALAWVVRNRRDAAAPVPCDAVLSFGDGSLAGACRSLAGDIAGNKGGGSDGAEGKSVGEQLRALAMACQVLTGDLPDPTGGAVLLHRHDEQPCWAAGRRPAALLGSHFFYRLD